MGHFLMGSLLGNVSVKPESLVIDRLVNVRSSQDRFKSSQERSWAYILEFIIGFFWLIYLSIRARFLWPYLRDESLAF
jgi:hypothetical protein